MTRALGLAALLCAAFAATAAYAIPPPQTWRQGDPAWNVILCGGDTGNVCPTAAPGPPGPQPPPAHPAPHQPGRAPGWWIHH